MFYERRVKILGDFFLYHFFMKINYGYKKIVDNMPIINFTCDTDEMEY